MSNEKPYNKEIRKHMETVRCPKCGAYYVAENGHVCDKSASGETMEFQKRLKEGYSIVTCPKCGEKYIASDGHDCPKDK